MVDITRNLRKKQVTLVDEARFLLECNECHTRWSPNIPEGYSRGKRLHKGYADCPKGCNDLPARVKLPVADLPTGDNGKPLEWATPEAEANYEMIRHRFPALDPYSLVCIALSITPNVTAYGYLYSNQKEDLKEHGVEWCLNQIEKTYFQCMKARTSKGISFLERLANAHRK